MPKLLVTCASIVVAWSVLLTWFNWLYQEPPITYVGTIGILAESKEVKHGESVIFHVTRCAKADYQAVATRRFTDGLIWDVPDLNVAVTKGCQTYDRAALVVPNALPIGKYRIEGETVVKVQWFIFSKERAAHFSTDTFTVTK